MRTVLSTIRARPPWTGKSFVSVSNYESWHQTTSKTVTARRSSFNHMLACKTLSKLLCNFNWYEKWYTNRLNDVNTVDWSLLNLAIRTKFCQVSRFFLTSPKYFWSHHEPPTGRNHNNKKSMFSMAIFQSLLSSQPSAKKLKLSEGNKAMTSRYLRIWCVFFLRRMDGSMSIRHLGTRDSCYFQLDLAIVQNDCEHWSCFLHLQKKVENATVPGRARYSNFFF